jgi:hypothetical protein
MSEHDHDRNGGSKRSLSEISHLFLSGIREQAGGEHRARPVRTPPGAASSSTPQIRPATPERIAPQERMVPQPPSVPTMRMADVDLTPEEFATVFGRPIDAAPPMHLGETIAGDDAADESAPLRKRVTAILGTGQGADSLGDGALAYAASLAARGERVGVIVADGEEFRLQCVSCDDDAGDLADDAEPEDRLDARAAGDAAIELNHDVDRWLLVIGDPRRPEARDALRNADDWTLLCTCDHDGIVSGYRTLKGLAEGEKSPLAVALVDAPDAMQANKVYTKLASVCRQFLDWDLRHDALETDVETAQARTAMRAPLDDASARRAAWSAVSGLLALAPDDAADRAHYGEDVAPPSPAQRPIVIPQLARPIVPAAKPVELVEEPAVVEPVVVAAPMVVAPIPNGEQARRLNEEPKREVPMAASVEVSDEVIELPEGASVLSAVLKSGTQLLATPIAPPMCQGATVAVDRDRAIVLVAQANVGLAGVDAIATAVRWLDDSKQLIAMAMPQLAIDATLPARVLLLVDQSDRAAIAVRPLFAGSDGRVTVRSYRKLRWAGRVGLLLDAA